MSDPHEQDGREPRDGDDLGDEDSSSGQASGEYRYDYETDDPQFAAMHGESPEPRQRSRRPALRDDGDLPPSAGEDDDDDGLGAKMTLGEHLEELRMRIMWGGAGLLLAMIGTVAVSKYIMDFLRQPYARAMRDNGLEPRLVALTLVTAMSVYFKIALIAGLVISAPWVFYHLWQFIAAGLYPREKRYVYYAVPSSAGLFIAGALFFFFVIAEKIFSFLIAFTLWSDLEPQFTFDDYVSFLTRMMLVFGLGFQTPIVVFLLGKMGLVSVKTLNRYRRHVIVLMLVLAAFCTSPSPVDQVLLAVPMWLLYEVGVLLVWLFVERKEKLEALEDQ